MRRVAKSRGNEEVFGFVTALVGQRFTSSYLRSTKYRIKKGVRVMSEGLTLNEALINLEAYVSMYKITRDDMSDLTPGAVRLFDFMLNWRASQGNKNTLSEFTFSLVKDKSKWELEVIRGVYLELAKELEIKTRYSKFRFEDCYRNEDTAVDVARCFSQFSAEELPKFVLSLPPYLLRDLKSRLDKYNTKKRIGK